ncbi:hypothetical protein OBRU01_11218 [Operophtera brumata]|uniref:Fucosyltransferase n=1 Tax=Operophtera brumata TaxID=104452 RepID=A0A0L7LD09_OPEBR|nr:hypothetical protein OBRU01_11218 [Operophtera brumata]
MDCIASSKKYKYSVLAGNIPAHDNRSLPQSVYHTSWSYGGFLNKILTRGIFLVTCIICFTSALTWINLVTVPDQPVCISRHDQEPKVNVTQICRSMDYRKSSRFLTNFKHILLWNAPDYAPFYYFGKGQRAFLQNNCSAINCYVTSKRKFFGADTTKFDAIAFNGRLLKTDDLPKNRTMYQKFIFFNMESADKYPVCNGIFDGFFNWTSTYRLNSDIPSPYLMVRNNTGQVIGPKADVGWENDFPEITEEYSWKLMKKSKAAAWFVSNCLTRSRREDYVKRLQDKLALYGHTVDVYGKCRPLKCPRQQKKLCNTRLETDYFFYLSLENSFAEDYVTEKLLTALQHDVVPIVYGGANYERFLPPGSYIDARKYNAADLAALMDRIIKTPKIYQQFFRWKSQLTYSDPSLVENVCELCKALNDQEKFQEKSVYDKFRMWWNPNYHNRC